MNTLLKHPTLFRPFRLLALLCLLVPALVPGLHGANGANGEPEAEPMLEMSFRTYARGQGNHRDLFYQAAPDRFEPLRVLRGSRSHAHEYRGTREFAIYRREASGDPEEPWRYRPVAIVELSESGDDSLLLITPYRGNANNNGNSREFTIAVLPTLTNAVDNEEIAFFNGTGVPLLGVFGTRQIQLDHGMSRGFSIGDFPPGEGILLGLTVRYQDSIRPVFHNHLNFSANSRYIMVLLPPDRPNSFEIVAFRLSI